MEKILASKELQGPVFNLCSVATLFEHPDPSHAVDLYIAEVGPHTQVEYHTVIHFIGRLDTQKSVEFMVWLCTAVLPALGGRDKLEELQLCN